jgi:hypothetical protein
MCIYSYTYVCASAYKSRTRRCAGSLKGFSGFAFPRRICAIAITCRIRAGHRVSAIPINAIRVRLCFAITILYSYTIHIRDPRSRFPTRFTFAIRVGHRILAIPFSHSRDPILALRNRLFDLDSPHDSHSLFAHSPHSGQAVAVRTEIRSRTPSPTLSHHDRSDTKRSDIDSCYW